MPGSGMSLGAKFSVRVVTLEAAEEAAPATTVLLGEIRVTVPPPIEVMFQLPMYVVVGAGLVRPLKVTVPTVQPLPFTVTSTVDPAVIEPGEIAVTARAGGGGVVLFTVTWIVALAVNMPGPVAQTFRGGSDDEILSQGGVCRHPKP